MADIQSVIRKAIADRNDSADIIDELSSLIYGQITTYRMPRWSVLRLEWDNMMKYGDGNSIDFSVLRDCISGIIAPNDSGKSSIIDILMFALYGESFRVNKHNIERVGAHAADRRWTSVWICTIECLYRIDREIKNSRNVLLHVYASPLGDPIWSLQLWGSLVQTQRRLAAIIGDAELFRNIAVSSPGDINICNCNYLDRFKLFAHLFGFAGLTSDTADQIADEVVIRSHRDVLRGELIGLNNYQLVDTTMGMTANEIEWLTEKFSSVNSAEVVAELRAQLATSVTRDTVLVYNEYEEAACLLRNIISGTNPQYSAQFKWNEACDECAHNRLMASDYSEKSYYESIEILSADRDRLAAEYDNCRKTDFARLELAYAEKYVAWTAINKLASKSCRVAEIDAEIARLDRSIKIHEVFRGIIQDGIIAGILCEWCIGGAIDEANTILQEMECDFRLFAEFIRGKNGLKLMTCSAHTRIPVELGGGFQRFACGLAIRAAIARQTGGPDILIIDEGFDCMDAVNRFRCIDAFPTLTKIFKTFIIISHLENITTLLRKEHTLYIQLISGLSRVRNTRGQLSIPEKNKK